MKILFPPLIATAVIFLSLWEPVSRQAPNPASGQSKAVISAHIYARVVDRKTDANITGLQAVDFTVVATREQLKITSVEQTDSSLAILYLINIEMEAGIVFTKKEREVTNQALKTLGEEDRFAAFQLIRGGRTQKLLGFEENRILPELDYKEKPASELKKRYSYYEPLKEVIAYLNANAGTRRKVLLVTDASSVLLYPAPPFDKPAQDIYELFLRSGIEVYWLSHNMGFVHAFTGKKPSCCDWKKLSFDKFDAKKLIALTGGELMGFGHSDINKAINNLRPAYELRFQPSASLATDTPQLIEVKLAPHLKLKEKEWRVIAPRAVIVPKAAVGQQ